MTSAIEREFKRLHSEQNRINLALQNMRAIEKWIEYVDMQVVPVASVYSSGYDWCAAVTLDPQSVDSFNDGTFADYLDGLAALLNVDAEHVTSEDFPASRCRKFRLRSQREGIAMEYTLSAYLNNDSRCQIIVEREEEVTTERWVKVTERKPVLRFICPEE